jgi:hypothetical protein
MKTEAVKHRIFLANILISPAGCFAAFTLCSVWFEDVVTTVKYCQSVRFTFVLGHGGRLEVRSPGLVRWLGR